MTALLELILSFLADAQGKVIYLVYKGLSIMPPGQSVRCPTIAFSEVGERSTRLLLGP